MTNSTDPGGIHTVVVTATDLVAALEASYRSPGRKTVLRMTPPFGGRMRARLHVQRESASGDRSSVLLTAESLVDDDCPVPPEPDDVEDALRADETITYSIESHRERYRVALQEWRSAVPGHVVDEVELPAVDRKITPSILGTVSGE